MARGGARKGAGRKRGPNRANAVRAERAAKTGPMPCEIMLEAMRYFRSLAARHSPKGQEPDQKKSTDYLREAAAIAKDAAPYYHPRLAQTTLQSNPDKPIIGRLEIAFV